MINALFVEKNGIYFKDEEIIPWDEERNAFSCNNGMPAICHPPCKRWGRYWSGGPSVKTRRVLGDDSQAFAFCLWYVRTFGGVIEHPEASHAFKYYGIKKPPIGGGWVNCDEYGGYSCCVYQGHYGHRAPKATWLYLNKYYPLDLIWGRARGEKIEEGFHSKEEARKARSKEGYIPSKRLSVRERLATPLEFKNLSY
ncbi:MAG: hypothetical protein ACPGJV_14185 [Bacteriovoracaceae bacterium]